MPDRAREVAAIGRTGLLDVSVAGAHAALRFFPHAGVRERLEAIVAAETRCCSFITFGLHDDDGQIVLRIDAPEDAQPVLEQFVAAFVPEEAAA